MAINLDALSGVIKTLAFAFKDDSSPFGTGHKPEVYSELGDLVLKILSVYAEVGSFIPPPDALHPDDFSSLSYHVQNELLLPKPHADVVVVKSLEVLISVANFATGEIQSTIGQAISEAPSDDEEVLAKDDEADEDEGEDDEEDEEAQADASDAEETDSDDQSGAVQAGIDSAPEPSEAPVASGDVSTDAAAPSEAPEEAPTQEPSAEPSEEDISIPSEGPSTSVPDADAASAKAATADDAPPQDAPVVEAPASDDKPADAPTPAEEPTPLSPDPVGEDRPGEVVSNDARAGGVLAAVDPDSLGKDGAPPEEQLDGDPKPTPSAEQ